MSTMTLAAEPTNVPPRVKVVISTGTAATVTALDLRRDGQSVRTLPDLGLASVVVYDYEASFGVPVTYTAQVTTSAGIESLSGSVTLMVDTAWLIHPRQPSLSVPVGSDDSGTFLAAIGEASADSQAARHRVIGSARDVVMSFGRRSDPSYSGFEIVTTTEGEAEAVADLLRDETPILVRMPAVWDANFVEDFYAVQNWSALPVADRNGQWLTRWSLPLSPAVAPKVIVQPENSYAAGLLFDSYGESFAAQPTYFDRLVS